jgi:hypothetical protein
MSIPPTHLSSYLIGLQAARGENEDERPKVWLLEYDKRFEVFPEFVFYDFKSPMKLPREFSLDGMGWGNGLMRGE